MSHGSAPATPDVPVPAAPVVDRAALTEVECAVLDAIDEPALVETLAELIRIPSVTGSDAESHAQHVIADRLGRLGCEVDLWAFDLPALEADPEYPGTEVDRTEGYGMVGRYGGDGDVALILQGHIDVVPIGDPAAWQRPPYAARTDGLRMYGRGACDMKGGVAANLAVVAALHSCGVRLERPLAVHSVVGEEDGGLGAFATLRRGHTGEVALIPEPTDGRLITANAGALTFRLEVPGLSAHGSVRREGHSAVEAYLPLHRAIVELEAERNAVVPAVFGELDLPYGISVGRVQAGDWASSVPDLLVAEGRMGVALGEDPAAARAAFEQRIAQACAADPWLAEHPATVTWPGGQFASGRTTPGHPWIGQVQSTVAAVTGVVPIEAGAPYGSDLRLYTGIGGIPTLHYGPGSAAFAHSPHEQVPLAEVISTARALALLAVRRTGAHF